MTSNAHELGVSVGAWNALVRRARMGRERKVACLVVSSYARANGTGIHCGVARLAVDLEVSHRTARRYLAWLRGIGLIELVRPGNRRRGLSDEYRLILGPDILEDLDVPDPDRYRSMCDDTHDARNGPAGDPDQGTPRMSPDEAPAAKGSGDTMVSPENRDQGTNSGRSGDILGVPPSPIYISQERSISHADDEDLRTDVAVDGAAEDSPNPDPPSKCGHGLSAATRADGRPACALCRVEADRAAGIQRFAPARPANPPPPGWIAPVIDLQTREAQ